MRAFKSFPPSRYHQPEPATLLALPGRPTTALRGFNLAAFMAGGAFEGRQLVPGSTLVLATGNNHKLHEFAHSITLTSLFNTTTIRQAGTAAPAETGTTYFDNAAIKALDAATKSGHPALGDDRGLAIDAYGGQPGIDTIEWLHNPAESFTKLADLKTAGKRMTATSACAIAIAWPDGTVAGFEVHARGELMWPPRGNNGFGFDSVFRRQRASRTYGEMSTTVKMLRSEVGDALRTTLTHLTTPPALRR